MLLRRWLAGSEARATGAPSQPPLAELTATGADFADDMSVRASQGILALLVWVVVAVKLPTPNWLAPLLPLPALLVVANALGPRPWLGRVHWRLSSRTWRTLIVGAIGLAGVELGFSLFANQPSVDEPVTLACASRSVLQGHDPYLTYEPQCAADLHYRTPNLTAIASGPFAHLPHGAAPAQIRVVELRDQRTGGHQGFAAMIYPPDAALLVLPIAFSGWTAIWCWVMALFLLLLAATWGGSRPRGWQALLAWQLLTFGSLAFAFSLGWDPEYLSYLLLALAFARIDQQRISALALAAAVCTNQLCWIAAPVYLAIVLREAGVRRRLTWLAGGVAVGLLPWLVWDRALPGEMLRFLTLPYFPGGDSLGAFATSPVGHSWPYLLGMIAWVGICSLIAWRSPEWRWAMVAVVWGAFIMSSFALDHYFLPMFWLSPAALLGAWRVAQAGATSGANRGATPMAAGPAT